ncbi:hypothetical protein, partial [Pseudomonas viridiflava]|uniref:hypothetical protein n=1 Tax=Pseudomonas viridiflava TaxID=33069 RepID=UPI0019805470
IRLVQKNYLEGRNIILDEMHRQTMSQVLHGTLFRLSTRPRKRTKTVDVIAYLAFNSSKARDFYEFDGLEVLLKLSVSSFMLKMSWSKCSTS